jgi:ankyrin repeat protein
VDIQARGNHVTKKERNIKLGFIWLALALLSLASVRPPQLLRAAWKGDSEAVYKLLKSGAPVDQLNLRGNSALGVALYKRRQAAASLLLQRGADPWLKDKDGDTAHIAAVEGGSLEALKLVLPAKFSKKQMKIFGLRDPLRRAIKEGHENMVEELLKHGFEPDWGYFMGKVRSPLMLAAEYGRLKAAQKLLEFGAQIDAKGLSSKTALAYAAEYQEPELAKLLLSCGAQPDPIDADRNTPLMLAAKKGNLELCALLLSYGADPDKKNKRRLLPWQLSCCGELRWLLRQRTMQPRKI